jgi:hypothetical protein
MIVNAWNGGMFKNANSTTNVAWTATSGTSIVKGSHVNGYNVAYGFGGTNTAPVDISFDGTNWYTAYYSSWPNDMVTATLDRNFAQASTATNKLKLRCKSYIVLQCSSSQKTFYVQIGLKAGNFGGPMLYTQPYESWSLGSHTGTTPGQMECLWAYPAPTADNGKVRYILCLYPEAIFLHLDGVQTTFGVNQCLANSMYVGNLDTSVFRTGSDPNALWAGWSNTSFSGVTLSRGETYNVGWSFWGNGMCLRTRGGSAWVPVTDYHVPTPNVHISPFAYCQFIPRMRTYAEFETGATVTTSGKTLLSTIDIYQGGATGPPSTYFATNNEGPCSQEGARGELRYLKVPVTNPSGQHLKTWGPMQDGKTYIIIRHAPYHWSANGNIAQVAFEVGGSNNVASSFGRAHPASLAMTNKALGDIWQSSQASSCAVAYRWLAMPVL